MKSNFKLQEEAIQKVNKLIEKCNGEGMPVVIKNIKCRFDLKGTTAGTYSYKANSGTLNFNMTIYKDNYDTFDQTIAHEVAHYVVKEIYGTEIDRSGRRISHGSNWKKIMLFLGYEPRRCHNYNVAPTVQRVTSKFTYKCKCNSHQLSPLRHKRVLGGAKYRCLSCGEMLVNV